MGRAERLGPWIERTTVTPRLFTATAWAGLTDNQREVIRRQRMAVVSSLAGKHDQRYHGTDHACALEDQLRADLRDTPNGGRHPGP